MVRASSISSWVMGVTVLRVRM
ncbi:hypothetical protein E2C01_099803 [Portunus trituberculatus]|uniref:Uncharacterized protein n=1 Tax=Portunus trituberculatus TaxID=210409 RepID=A0A5B7K4Q9_PORTR|nr:hypothetical protein [Portunus trituberculatus]